MMFAPSRRLLLLGGLALAGVAGPAFSGVAPRVVVYKSPSCGCCGSWTAVMQRAGFKVEVHDTDNLEPIWRRAGLSPGQTSCHTAFVAGYVIEGHVSPADVRRLMAERPVAIGLTVPGMPGGAPGMAPPGAPGPFDTLLVMRDGRTRVFAHHV